jgi:hypothetical protein
MCPCRLPCILRRGTTLAGPCRGCAAFRDESGPHLSRFALLGRAPPGIGMTTIMSLCSPIRMRLPITFRWCWNGWQGVTIR